MYDSVNFRLSLQPGESEALLRKLDSARPHMRIYAETSTGDIIARDTLNNYRYTIRPDMLAVHDGSLCKWMYGDNYSVLTRRDTKEAINRLSDYFSIDMRDAQITRLDIGVNMIVRNPPASYYDVMGALNGALPQKYNTSLYYALHSGNESLCFYDKNIQQRQAGQPIPELYQGCNVLRIEQRYMRPTRLLGGRITAKMLYNEKFYIKLVEDFHALYMDIEKINTHKVDMSQFNGVKDFYTVAAQEFIKNNGGYNSFMQWVKDMQKKGIFDKERARQFRELIRKLNDTAQKNVIVSESAEEITTQLCTALKYCR